MSDEIYLDRRELYLGIQEKWLISGIPACNGAADGEIADFEKHYKVVLPEDFREYVKILNGVPEGESGEDAVSFYELSRIKPVTEDLVFFTGTPDCSGIVKVLERPEEYFVFADYLMHSHVYAVQMTAEKCEESPVFRICGRHISRLSRSFYEFMDGYLRQEE